MITLLGVTLSYEAIGFLAAFVASEVIGASPLKENSVAATLKTLIDNLKPMRKEDEKVEEVKKATELLREALRRIGD